MDRRHLRTLNAENTAGSGQGIVKLRKILKKMPKWARDKRNYNFSWSHLQIKVNVPNNTNSIAAKAYADDFFKM